MTRRRAPEAGHPPFPTAALAFVRYYVLRRRLAFGAVFALVVAAALCAVAVQYGMRLLVDAMAAGAADRPAVWAPLAAFMGLIAAESALWRLAGWLAARTIVATGVDIRLDLFGHLSGQAMRYFADHMGGALGGRITAAAGAFGAVMAALVWNITPPCADFLGALAVFLAVDWRMAAALLVFVTGAVAGLAFFGMSGRPLHRAYAERAGRVGGELVDTVANVWAVKAFSARERERGRLAGLFGAEAGAQARSWLHLERTRVVHDLALWVVAGCMLAWAVHLWSAGRVTPGEVVMVSALTFRILHGSRDLALALVATTQQFAIIGEALRVVARPHAVPDRHDARPFVPAGGAIEFRDVTFAHPGGGPVFAGLSLRVPAGQKVGLAGPSGAGEVDAGGAGPAARRRPPGGGPRRRPAGDRRHPGQPAGGDRGRAAGHRPVPPLGDGERPLRAAGRERRGGPGRRPGRLLRRLRPGHARGVRHGRGRARGRALGRPAAAARHRARDPEGRADPAAGRGDLGR